MFGLLQLVAFSELIRSHMASKQFRTLLRSAVVLIGFLGAGMVALLTMKGWIAPWTGRFYSLWDTEYAKKYAQKPLNAVDQSLKQHASPSQDISLSLHQSASISPPPGHPSSWTFTSSS